MIRLLKLFFLRMLRHSHNSPHEIAMGISVGLFIGLGPTFGFQLIPTLFFCYFFKFNKVSGTVGVFITNPFTVIPIYLFNYWLGSLFFSNDINASEILREATQKEHEKFFEKIKYIYQIIKRLGLSFLLGCFITSSFCSFVGYFVTKKFTTVFLERRKIRLSKKSNFKKGL